MRNPGHCAPREARHYFRVPNPPDTPPKLYPGTPSPLAVGAWSNPAATYYLSQTGRQIAVLQQERALLRGLRGLLYLPVRPGLDAYPLCTCTKTENNVADKECRQCYGSRYVPGFLRSCHETQWWSVADYVDNGSGWTLTNMAVDQVFRPWRFVLAEGQTTGTVVTPQRGWTNPTVANAPPPLTPGPSAWTAQVIGADNVLGNTVTVEFELDNAPGVWRAFDATVLSLFVQGSGLIRLRITMTRATADTESPSFEIARMRRPLHETSNPYLHRMRSAASSVGADAVLQPGEVLFVRTPVNQVFSIDARSGLRSETVNDTGWMPPLSFFDLSIEPNTPAARINEDGASVHPFYAYTSLTFSDQRHILTNGAFSDVLGVFTTQTFTTRRVQPIDPINAVW